MNIPDYETIMMELLEFARDKEEHSLRNTITHISNLHKLTEDEKKALLPSGQSKIIDNRVGWARTYLKKAKLLEDPKRGFFKITQRGLDVLKEPPKKINSKYLMKFPEFKEFQTVKKKTSIKKQTREIEESSETPEERIEEGYNEIKENLMQELLEKLRNGSPEFFEKIVVDLLINMGYGEGKVTGGPGDGGIDGIIYQDKLGVDKIYLQAKRYAENKVIGQNPIKHFIGVLETHGASKGIFITTSSFQKDVFELIDRTSKNIVLINGYDFVKLMFEYNLGVTTDKKYEIKKTDSDYFED